MKRLFIFHILSFLLLTFGILGSSCTGTGDGWRIVDGVIVFDAPARAPGQQSVLGLATEPMQTVRIGFVGVGARGSAAVYRYTYLDGVEIKALCDLYPDHLDRARQYLSERGCPPADEYSGDEGWKRLCEREDIDLVYIATGWQMHTPIAVYAMEHGKHVAIEVPAATSLDECWQLVDTAEKTQRHCMMLENCVYDFFELTTLNMAQQGLFGEVLHTEGAYIHNLEPFWDSYQDNWRLEFNQSHRGDVYATHGLGPVCQVLDIHRGDRMSYLVAMDTKSVNGLQLAREKMGADSFANADHTLTCIKTEKGHTIHLQHNVFTPRPYNRMYQVTGTHGFAAKYPVEGYAFRRTQVAESLPDYENLDEHGFIPDDARAQLMERYKSPIVLDVEQKAREVGGHGGMDFIMDYRLIYCLRNGLPLDQDVYDAAEWSCIGALTSMSLEHRSAPVEVPDFTRGDWQKIDGYRHAVAETK